jgi:hypothetical protein
MQKKRVRKLGLSRETLRFLEAPRLGAVRGGDVSLVDTKARSAQTACCPSQACPVQV